MVETKQQSYLLFHRSALFQLALKWRLLFQFRLFLMYLHLEKMQHLGLTNTQLAKDYLVAENNAKTISLLAVSKSMDLRCD